MPILDFNLCILKFLIYLYGEPDGDVNNFMNDFGHILKLLLSEFLLSALYLLI